MVEAAEKKIHEVSAKEKEERKEKMQRKAQEQEGLRR